MLGCSLVAATLFTACGPEPLVPPKNFTEMNEKILFPSCGKFSSCHSDAGASNANNLNMSTKEKAYMNLVNANAENMQAKMEGRKRVLPGNPAESFLIIKLTLPNDNGPYEARMPEQNPPLDQVYIDAIRDWIARGAPND